MVDDKSPKTGISTPIVEADAADQGDIEAFSSRPQQAAVRKDLKRRHINMISIAGMIVRTRERLYLHRKLTQSRALVSS